MGLSAEASYSYGQHVSLLGPATLDKRHAWAEYLHTHFLSFLSGSSCLHVCCWKICGHPLPLWVPKGSTQRGSIDLLMTQITLCQSLLRTSAASSRIYHCRRYIAV